MRSLRSILPFAVAPLAMAACSLATAGTASDVGEDSGVADAYRGALDAGAIDATSAHDGEPGVLTDAADTGAAADAADGLLDVLPDVAPPLVARLNIDGPKYVGVDNLGDWAASPVPGACGPSHYENANPVHGTRDAPLFQGEAFGNPAKCTVGAGALPAGTYRVRMYFGEIYFGPGCPAPGGVGSRVFDIVLEGKTVLSKLDVFAESGGCVTSTTSAAAAPIVKSFDVAITDGTLDISLPATADNGKISALEVFGPL